MEGRIRTGQTGHGEWGGVTKRVTQVPENAPVISVPEILGVILGVTGLILGVTELILEVTGLILEVTGLLTLGQTELVISATEIDRVVN